MIKFSGSLSGWSYPISHVAPRSDCIPPATVRNSKYAPSRSNANYSFKYFGKGQGVSVYSFIDERDLLLHSLVFSAGERESAYVIDGLMHNDVVRSDIHSTDSFGFSEAIFGVSHLLSKLHPQRRTEFDRLYQKVVDDLDKLLCAVGLKAA